MAEPLTDDWIEALSDAARGAAVDPSIRLTLQQVVTGTDGDELVYAIRLRDGKVTVERGRVGDADISFSQDRSTAAAIASGDLSAQAAFMAGRLRVGGDLRAVLGRAPDLDVLDDVFAAARAATGR